MSKERKRKTLDDLVKSFNCDAEAVERAKSFDNPEIETAKKDLAQDQVRSGSGQDQHSTDTGSASDQVRIRSGSTKDQVKDQHSTDTGSASDQVRIRSGSGSGQLKKELSQATQNKASFLTEKQAKVYYWFLDKGLNGVFNKEFLARETGIPHSGIRKIINKLTSDAILIIGEYDAGSRVFPYKINNDKTIFSASVENGIRSVSDQVRIRSGSGSGQDQVKVSLTRSSYNSSSSFLNIKTTTSEFFEHPESEFWIKAGVTPEMFEKNIEKHGIDPNVFIRSAKHYAFEYSQPGKVQPETNHLTHLIGGIRQYSEWVKVNGYISFEDRQKRLSEAIACENTKRFEEWNKAKRERAFSEWLVKFIEAPESEEVKAVLDKANPIQKRSIEKGADSAMMTLRALWEKE